MRFVKRSPGATRWRGIALLGTVLAISGCASNNTRPTESITPTQKFVVSQINDTAASIDKSLGVLVALERGNAGLRKSGVIGDTIAGQKSPDISPPSMPSKPQPQTELGKHVRETALLNYNKGLLNKRMTVQWDGSVDHLLSGIAAKVSYRFVQAGTASLPEIHINKKDVPAKNVLAAVANKINGAGVVKIFLAPRVVCLIRGQDKTLSCDIPEQWWPSKDSRGY